ncbi:olfactory receptor 7G2-like [Onychomys torridus]|uniref:olfactory receptor 7G2-like n=1 Tax=Onychomys torridus TaxID=38674 RepID=UPI00167F7BC4|nr:olfactory receptor 7G2-like [Onychomys torridus]
MESKNQTGVSEFFLMGITDDLALQPLVFSLFTSMYLITILGNVLIILTVSSDSHLQTPMCIFLSNLSFNDICLSTTIIPKMMVNIQTQDQSITCTGCLTQICFILLFCSLESYLLSAMSYDRYVAICHLLTCTTIMDSQTCGLLVLLSLIISLVNTGLLGLMVLRLSFCTDLDIPLFFCELAQVIKLACSDTLINYVLIYLATIILNGIPVSGIIFSYIEIVSSVLRISSMKGRYKAFSTCGAHMAVVSLFYGTALGVYISSSLTSSVTNTALAYVMCTLVPQMLNPFIYSLRNRDMKVALRKHISTAMCLL